jgi:hypothetical protein
MVNQKYFLADLIIRSGALVQQDHQMEGIIDKVLHEIANLSSKDKKIENPQ